MSEAPLVFFTTCVPAAVGLTACSALLGGGVLQAAVALVFASAGMAGSIFHLAKPLRAPTSLRGLGSSPLSQEIGAVVVLWALLLAWLVAEGIVLAWAAGITLLPSRLAVAAPVAARVSCVLAALWGAVLLCVINRAYRAPMRPAWDGPEGLGELVGIACGVGGSLCGLVGSAVAVLAGSGFAFAAWNVVGGSVLEDAAAIVPCIASCVLPAVCMLCPEQRRARLQFMADGGDARVLGALDTVGKQARGPRYACVFSAAGAMLALLAMTLHLLLTAPAVAAVCWGVAAVLQLVAAVALRMAFYSIPAPARGAWPLRK